MKTQEVDLNLMYQKAKKKKRVDLTFGSKVLLVVAQSYCKSQCWLLPKVIAKIKIILRITFMGEN